MGEETDANVIEADMVGEREMVVFFDSDLVNSGCIRVLWVSFYEVSE